MVSIPTNRTEIGLKNTDLSMEKKLLSSKTNRQTTGTRRSLLIIACQNLVGYLGPAKHKGVSRQSLFILINSNQVRGTKWASQSKK